MSTEAPLSSPRLVLAATFVAEPLEVPLAWILAEAGLGAELCFAPYHQVFQQLLTPGSALVRNAEGTNVMLLRLEDFVREQVDPLRACAMVQQVAVECAAALESFSRGLRGALIVAVLPASPALEPLLLQSIALAAEGLVQRVHGLPGMHVLDEQAIAAVAGTAQHDPVRDALAHIPYTDSHFAALALAIARKVHALRVPACKVLVLDCDNTLWRGVVGEDGVDGIELTAPYLAVQDFAIAQQAQGVLVCLASKNAEADVLAVLDQRPDMRLKRSHVVSHRINWLPKAVNLRAMAVELNLGLDAFVFLDDNPVECAQMRAELPQVVTLQLPGEAQIESLLRHLWAFDKLGVTAEDAQRTRMYRENAERRALESSAGDISQFLAALDLQIDIAPPEDDEWPRVEQLTQRTNQFNFSTRRRSAAELRALAADGAHVLRVRVRDRFGDYGLVGDVVARGEGRALQVDTLLLSCRVLGRGVEHAMLRRLGELARDADLTEVCLPYIPTARNEPARAFADSVAAAYAEPAEAHTLYRIPTAVALAISHRPGEDPPEVVEALRAEEAKGSRAAPEGGGVPASAGALRSARYAALTELDSGEAVQRQLAARARQVRTLPGQAVPPASAMEGQLLGLWEALLGIDGLGVEDDYFALGGTSLLSVRLFAEIQRQFGVQLRLTTILAAPTVRALARFVDPDSAPLRGGLVTLRAGGTEHLFLVHDGFGETLLYRHLAQRLPGSLSIHGIEPRRLPGIPLAHASIEAMAADYVAQIRRVQPHGPYRLGGMCAGGVLAYQMAVCLTRAGEAVELVAILDGATPQAAKRAGRISSRRLARLQSTLGQGGAEQSASLAARLDLVITLARKARNVIVYEVGAAATRLSVQLRFGLLRLLVARDAGWPRLLPELQVIQIYSQLEARYRPPALGEVPVLLVRAAAGEDADTPYREIYRDADFGWSAVAAQLKMADVDGGHASMLQEQFIDSLASVLRDRLYTESLQPSSGGQ